MKPAMVWQVQPDDGERVGAIVDKMVALGAPATARVFLNGRPADRDEPVQRFLHRRLRLEIQS